MKDYIQMKECPFQRGDIVKCIHSGIMAIVEYVEDEHVYCQTPEGAYFSRTWSHDMGYKSGGWLTLVERPVSDGEIYSMASRED